MSTFSIAVDLSHLMPASGPLNASVFPHLAFAVQAILDRCEITWKEYASGVPLPSGRSIGIRTGEYLRSISQRKSGDFSGEVFSALPLADVIEHGAPAWDMHALLNSSLKVRRTFLSGKRFLIIPFRHDVGNAISGGRPMPQAVHEWWAGKVSSYVKDVGERPVHSDIKGLILPFREVYDWRTKRVLMTPSRTYSWGDRLRSRDLAALGVSASQAKRMSGMVNFRKPGASGGAAHSQFITFRTMSEGSKGWVRPAREGYWPAKMTADRYRPIAEALFQRAVEDDIRSAMPT
jgi:hypothetical protein